jgi:preprotein translocase subunit SecA
MSRQTMGLWGSRLAADWKAPERPSRPVGSIDRWLAGVAAALSLRFDFIERRSLTRFARRAQQLALPLQALGDDDLRTSAAALRIELTSHGLTDALAARAFALAGEASFRLMGKRPYLVQLMGGYGVLRGRLVEMATGEGKTLTALLPSFALALAGIPVHVVTVNDYLARRDAAYVSAVFDFFGISIGVVTHEEDEAAKRQAYRCDVTYCVNKDLVFDYLHDGLQSGADKAAGRMQRGLYFAIVDEADGVLIDEARTPLIIARERAAERERGDAALGLRLARSLRTEHFRRDPGGSACRLTHEGRLFLASFDASQADPAATTAALWQVTRAREERVEQALAALHVYCKGAQYVVVQGKINIVDEFTGRILPDRTWERGLHQMIELKEDLQVTAPRDTLARQTYPGFFGRYLRVAGMTGTGSEVAAEMRVRFGMLTVRIPTHRPRVRAFLGIQLFATAEQRWQAIAVRAAEFATSGRPVLIGTRSVQASHDLSAVLTSRNLPHSVLNALQDSKEAEIISMAGQPGRITVATNMAGRGTDIHLDDSVRIAGGLHVILSEFHESARIDRQLYGRAGRQGDPGSAEAMVCLEDELFVQYAAPLVRFLRSRSNGRLRPLWGNVLQWMAQSRAERGNRRVRRAAVERDLVMQSHTTFSGMDR